MTFSEKGIHFTYGSGCITCRDNSCQNTVTLKNSKEEFNVHISTYTDRSEFRIHASSNTNTESTDDICVDFNNKLDAVKFIYDTFYWFTCF
jgi:hypothetical protein